MKVAGRNGATDVPAVLEAMHWVSAYRDEFNIRVLNLSWGTPSPQSPTVDPIDYAVERLWQQGIVEADNPTGLIAASYIKGSGTSEAAAVTSGAIAVLLQARPRLSPYHIVDGCVTASRPSRVR